MHFGQYLPFTPNPSHSYVTSNFGVPTLGAPNFGMNPEISLVHQRLDQMTNQVVILNDLIHRLCADLAYRAQGTPPNVTPLGAGGGIVGIQGGSGNGYLMSGAQENSFSRFRENESFLCWELFIPGLSLNDIEVEVVGNRVIARTRTALHPLHRQALLFSLPRGIEAFELPDGRFECCWAVPVSFEPKEVESAFRDGWISIYVPRVAVAPRHAVRVSKESSHARKASELTA